MAQTKSASNRRNSTTSSKGNSSSSNRSSSRAKSSGTTQSTARSLAGKLKTPAIASGAAAAGLAGGLALAGRGSRKKLLGVSLPTATGNPATSKNLAETAKQLGAFAERAGELASEVRMAREGLEQNQKRSPIEVVLQGLTSRRI